MQIFTNLICIECGLHFEDKNTEQKMNNWIFFSISKNQMPRKKANGKKIVLP